MLAAASCAFALGLAELVSRVDGIEPFQPPRIGIRVEPGGRYQRMHPALGYEHLPGHFRITFPNGRSWEATHRGNTLRITRPLDEDAERLGESEVWLFGGSFVHGWGLDDEETFPWKLQSRLADDGVTVVNFGVGGYGTLQSLVQFREALEERSAPDLAVLAYAGFHDERNALLRRWKKAAYAYRRFGPTVQPYARLGWDGQLDFDFGGGYGELPLLRRSAFLHLVERVYNRFEDQWKRSHAVSRQLVLLFDEVARRAGVDFALVGIARGERTSAMIRFARKHGIPARDISVRLEEPGFGIPWDGHPSELATDVFAERLERFLEAEGVLDGEGGVPGHES